MKMYPTKSSNNSGYPTIPAYPEMASLVANFDCRMLFEFVILLVVASFMALL